MGGSRKVLLGFPVHRKIGTVIKCIVLKSNAIDRKLSFQVYIVSTYYKQAHVNFVVEEFSINPF